MNIEFQRSELTASEQSVVSEGFRAQNEDLDAPEYIKERVKWLGVDELNDVRAALTAECIYRHIFDTLRGLCFDQRNGPGSRNTMAADKRLAMT